MVTDRRYVPEEIARFIRPRCQLRPAISVIFFRLLGQGTNLSWDPRRSEAHNKRHCLKRHLQTFSRATHPCAFAYRYARIRRLVGFVPGLYRLWVAGNPATGFSDPTRYKFNDAPVCRVCDDSMVAVRGRPSGLPGLIPLGSLTRAQLPPLLV